MKGIRGLKAQKRGSRVIHGLYTNLLEDLDNDMDNSKSADTSLYMPNSDENQVSSTESPVLKQRIKLLTSYREWEIAKDFFKFKFQNHPIADGNLDSTIEHMSDVIYSYFKQNYGTVNSANHGDVKSSYRNKSIRELKKELKGLKAKKADTIEIQFVVNLLRKRLHKTDMTCLASGCHSTTVNHYQYIGKNFGDMVKPSLSNKPTQIFHLARKPVYIFSLISLHVSNQGSSVQSQHGFLYSPRQNVI